MIRITLLLLWIGANLSASAQSKQLQISIMYYGNIDTALKTRLLTSIANGYHCRVYEIAGVNKLPSNAFYKLRNRYRADKILEKLKRYQGMDIVLAITDKDISTTHNGIYDWGIMGLSYQPGGESVVSTYRMKNANKELFYDRCVKVVLHELGHSMGLSHCTNSSLCYMTDAAGKVSTIDGENLKLCPTCSGLLND